MSLVDSLKVALSIWQLLRQIQRANKGKENRRKLREKPREKQPLNAIITLISYHTYCTGSRINPREGERRMGSATACNIRNLNNCRT